MSQLTEYIWKIMKLAWHWKSLLELEKWLSEDSNQNLVSCYKLLQESSIPFCMNPTLEAQHSQVSFQALRLWPESWTKQISIHATEFYSEQRAPEITLKLTSPPVRIARSCKFAFLFSPKPGALTAQTWMVFQLEQNMFQLQKMTTFHRTSYLDASTKLVKNQSAQCFTFHIFCNNQQRLLLLLKGKHTKEICINKSCNETSICYSSMRTNILPLEPFPKL